ncbi:MAG: hypothetical protein GX410_05480 [Elusimicrobia bacterium]|nr:hypothetical protein [Elusimicrobiota bacterium]
MNRAQALSRLFLQAVLSLVCATVLLEAGLRLAGWAARPRLPQKNSASKTVLCAGDSFVWGAGGKSFPAQLQEILDLKKPGVYRVLNAGTAGTNSAQMLSKLPAQLKLYRPDFLIILTGSSNYWNHIGERSLGWLERTAVYRFFSLALSGRGDGGGLAVLPSCACRPEEEPDGLPREETISPPKYATGGNAAPGLYLDAAKLLASGGNCAAAEKLALRAVKADGREAAFMAQAASVFSSCGDAAESCRMAENAASLSPDSRQTQVAMADCRLSSGDYAGAAVSYSELLREKPDPWLYAQLAQAYFENGELDASARSCEKGLSLFPAYAELEKLYLKTLVFGGKHSRGWKFLLSNRASQSFTPLLETFYSSLADIGEYGLAEKYADRLSGKLSERRQYALLAKRFAAAGMSAKALEFGEKAGTDCGAECLLAMGDAHARECRYDAASDLYSRAESAGMPRWRVLVKLAAHSACSGDCAAGRGYLREALRLSNGAVRARIAFARLEAACGTPASAWKAYEETLRLAPRSKMLRREAYGAAVASGKAKEFSSVTGTDLSSEAVPAENRLLWWMENGTAQRRLEKDLSAACGLARQAGAKVILSTYPEWKMSGAASAASAQRVPYLDFTALFRKRFAGRSEYVSADNSHCNSAGYRAMAEAYAEKIMELEQ